MVDIYILDRNLREKGTCDFYKSLIWATRYYDLGDCEVYVPASIENIELFRRGNYICRHDIEDDMVCRIDYIELDTGEDGDFLIVRGTDVRKLLQQRIIWGQTNCNGDVEEYIYSLIHDNLIRPQERARQMLKDDDTPILSIGPLHDFGIKVTEQVSYANIYDKVYEYKKLFEWGDRIWFNRETGLLEYNIYSGLDVSNNVIFSDDNDNLFDSKYTEDNTNIANIALVGGEGEGAARRTLIVGAARGVDRYEIFVDARDLSSITTWDELKRTFPPKESGGTGKVISLNGKYYYQLETYDIPIQNESHKSALIKIYAGGVTVLEGGRRYYRIKNYNIAELPNAAPEDNTELVINDVAYKSDLASRGVNDLAQYGQIMTFEGSIDPNLRYIYRMDYFLGDLVQVQNRYGVNAKARIVGVTEAIDESGYTFNFDFEYKDVKLENVYLLTEAGDYLLTERGERIVYEEV